MRFALPAALALAMASHADARIYTFAAMSPVPTGVLQYNIQYANQDVPTYQKIAVYNSANVYYATNVYNAAPVYYTSNIYNTTNVYYSSNVYNTSPVTWATSGVCGTGGCYINGVLKPKGTHYTAGQLEYAIGQQLLHAKGSVQYAPGQQLLHAAGSLQYAPGQQVLHAAGSLQYAKGTHVQGYRNGPLISNAPSGVLETTSLSVPVKFSFLDALSAKITNVPATLTLSATSTDPADKILGPNAFLSVLAQGDFNGSFSIVADKPITVGIGKGQVIGTNLLSGVFTDGLLQGQTGGSTASFLINGGAGSPPGTTLVYSSDFLEFLNNRAEAGSFAMTGLSTVLSALRPEINGAASPTASSLNSFKGDAVGNFASDPAPRTLGVPEPAAWTVILVGFGAVGAAIRRRRGPAIA